MSTPNTPETVGPRTTSPSTDSRKDAVSSVGPGLILLFLLVELVVLVLLLIAFLTDWDHLGYPHIPGTIDGVLPLAVPWGGALGGVSIALVGLSNYWRKMITDRPKEPEDWNAWYFVRLPLGAVFGTVGALIVVLLLGTIGLTDNGKIDISAQGTLVLFVIAFVIGYKQEVFRQLLSRVVTVILGPGDAPPPTTTNFSVDPSVLMFGVVALNSVTSKSITVTNRAAKLLRVPLADVVVEGDGFKLTGAPGNIPGGAEGAINITFAPTSAGSAAGTATITVEGVTRVITLTGSA